MTKTNFAISVQINQETGDVLAAYFRIREGKAAEVREIEEGVVFANYSKRGELLGIELLAPCRVNVFDKIPLNLPKKARDATRRFIKSSVPRELVAA